MFKNSNPAATSAKVLFRHFVIISGMWQKSSQLSYSEGTWNRKKPNRNLIDFIARSVLY